MELFLTNAGQSLLYKVQGGKTLNFLRTFARNYRASSLLPESLPGFVLG